MSRRGVEQPVAAGRVLDRLAVAVESPFAPALFCAATVISKHSPERVVMNAGWKSIGAELGLPSAPAGLRPLAFSDEHLTCRVDAAPGPAVGAQVLLLPAHLDPTMNLHSRLFLVEGASVVDEWRIDVRVGE